MAVVTCSTADALLRGVLARPDDDLPRLVYADWLEENGQELRAAFIRVQCVPLLPTTDYHQSGADCVCRSCQEARREAKFWPYLAAWADGEPFPARSGGADRVNWHPGGDDTRPVRVGFAGGFVEAVGFLALADFLEHAAAVFARQPVGRVFVDDCRHPPYEPGRGEYFERARGGPPSPVGAFGCAPIPAKLRKFWPHPWPGVRVYYQSEKQALDALSSACVAYGRKAARLP